MNMQIPQFFINPTEEALNVERLKAANFQNTLAHQAIGDEQQRRQGYESAYNALLAQQSNKSETIEPTSAIRQLYGEDAPSVQVNEQGYTPPQYQAPVNSSYAFIKGSQEANELFQKQQDEYYTQNIAPLLTHFIKTGDDENYQKLMSQLSTSTNPIAGKARGFASMLQGSSVPTPGKVSRIPMTEELRQVLLPMAANPAIKSAIQTIPIGELAEVSMVGDNITEFTSPREYGKSQEELELLRKSQDIRKRSNQLREAELEKKYSPEVQGAISESKEASKEVGKSVAEARKVLPALERKVAKGGLFDRLEQLVKSNPGAFGKLAQLKTGVAAFTDPKALEDAFGDIKARRQMEIQVRNLLDGDLKKMFGPPFSDSDLRIMFQMTGADLNSPTAMMEAISAARRTTEGEIASHQDTLKTVRRPTTIPRAMTPTKLSPDPRDLKAAAISAARDKKNRFTFNGMWYRIVSQNGTYTVLPEK